MMKNTQSFITAPFKSAKLPFALAAHLNVFHCTPLELGAKRPSLGAVTPGAIIQISKLQQLCIESAT
jgi:hypothetical protein